MKWDEGYAENNSSNVMNKNFNVGEYFVAFSAREMTTLIKFSLNLIKF